MEAKQDFNSISETELAAKNNPAFVAFIQKLQTIASSDDFLSAELPVSISVTKLVGLHGFKQLNKFCSDKDISYRMNSHFYKDGPVTTVSVNFSKPHSASEITDTGFLGSKFNTERKEVRKTILQKLLGI